jgi:hypothetical protein
MVCIVAAPVREERRDSTPPAEATTDPLPAGLCTAVFGLIVAGTFVAHVWLSNGYVFFADDWRVAQQSQSFGGLFESYNSHLSVVPLLLFRVVLAVTGFDTYLPFRVACALAAGAAAIALFVAVRARLGAAPALVVATIMLWYPTFGILPSTFSHFVALAATIVCGWALPREGRRMDIVVAVAAVVALCSSGVGVAGVVGALVFLLVRGAPLRRWLAVVVPAALWLAWWALVAESTELLFPRSTSQLVDFAVDGIWLSFKGLVGRNTVLASLLAALFVVNFVVRVRQGRRAAAAPIAWTTALVFWWLGLAYSRESFLPPDTFRYTLVGSAFVVLAFLPPTEVPRWRALTTRWTRYAWPATAAAIAIAAVIVAVNAGNVADGARAVRQEHQQLLASYLVALQGPSAVPDGERINGVPVLSAREFRDLVDDIGAPLDLPVDAPDRFLVQRARLRLAPAARGASACDRPSGVVQTQFVKPEPLLSELYFGTKVPLNPAPVTVRVDSGDEETVVEVRRFEDSWTTVGRLSPQTSADLTFPAFGSLTPWEVRAQDGCVTPPAGNGPPTGGQPGG